MVLSVGSEWMNVALLRTKADYSQERGINENSVTNGDLSQVLGIHQNPTKPI